MTVRADGVALGDLLAQLFKAEASTGNRADVHDLLAADVIKVHHVVRVSLPAVHAGDVLGGSDERVGCRLMAHVVRRNVLPLARSVRLVPLGTGNLLASAATVMPYPLGLVPPGELVKLLLRLTRSADFHASKFTACIRSRGSFR